MKYKPLIGFTVYGSNPFYISGYTLKTKFNNLVICFLFPSLLAIENLQNHLIFDFFILSFAFLLKSRQFPEKKGYSAESSCHDCPSIPPGILSAYELRDMWDWNLVVVVLSSGLA
jgi:hypothetical protein